MIWIQETWDMDTGKVDVDTGYMGLGFRETRKHGYKRQGTWIQEGMKTWMKEWKTINMRQIDKLGDTQSQGYML